MNKEIVKIKSPKIKSADEKKKFGVPFNRSCKTLLKNFQFILTLLSHILSFAIKYLVWMSNKKKTTDPIYVSSTRIWSYVFH